VGSKHSYPSRSFQRDRWAWLLFLTLSIGGGGLSWLWFHRRVLPIPAPATIAAKPFKLAVLEYGRILPKPDGNGLEAQRVEAQIILLRAHGFTPVSATQVVAAYQSGRALPERSVLLTFDGGYLCTYFAMHPVLERLKCPAVMLVETGCQARRDPAFVYWDRLQLMVDSGLWEIGTHGQIGSSASGQESFASSRSAIETHIRHAHVSIYSNLSQRTPPLAVAPSQAGPALAFQTDLFGINAPSDDPLHLKRVAVDSGWSAEKLVQRLEWAVAAPAQVGTTADELARWIPSGKEPIPSGTTILEGKRRSEVWLSGSRWANDWVLEARIRPVSGEFWFVQEESFGGRHWRFGGKQDTLYFQDRQPQAPPVTLVRMPRAALVYGWHDYRIIRRGAGLWVECDGKPLSEFPFVLPFSQTGNIGIVAAPDGASCRLEIAEARLKPIPYSVMAVNPDPSAAEIETLKRSAQTVAALSPQWAVRRDGRQELKPVNQDLFQMLRRKYAWDILPEIKLEGHEDPASTAWLMDLTKRASEVGWNGIRLDLSALSQADQLAWSNHASRLASELRKQNLRLAITPEINQQGGLQ
jgi:peptidoglycan/xylan/chitin deacetylase (PgdA/CDA1 family)